MNGLTGTAKGSNPRKPPEGELEELERVVIMPK